MESFCNATQADEATQGMSTPNDGNQKGCFGCHGLRAFLGDFRGPLGTGLI